MSSKPIVSSPDKTKISTFGESVWCKAVIELSTNSAIAQAIQADERDLVKT